MTDLANQVGGRNVTVVSLLKPGADPHEFQPSPGDFARIRDTSLIIASGKGLEPYLPKLRDNLAPGQKIVEAGATRSLPSHPRGRSIVYLLPCACVGGSIHIGGIASRE